MFIQQWVTHKSLNWGHFSRKYTAICVSQPACRSGPAAAFPAFQPSTFLPALGLVLSSSAGTRPMAELADP